MHVPPAGARVPSRTHCFDDILQKVAPGLHWAWPDNPRGCSCPARSLRRSSLLICMLSRVRHALQFRTNGKLSCVMTLRTPPVLTCTFSQVRSGYYKHQLAWWLIDWFAALEP
ncbi:Piso0_004950 [Millerozyma farinosa CBS 7064]|uniref:Piso0_004950 protein n=1 Tax=Pichia sorbitophila (strain ATCC MYA-4447 / BCRC 22081 / CBS 7064 / NBRC 10061 / NRRL Y-12695) TaxID=559304 RepID=G8Y3U2_PICSO|nr:Piso0_004950 [Millerozyma farinosa CBS 7064]